MNAKGKNFLKVVGIIDIVLAVLAIIGFAGIFVLKNSEMGKTVMSQAGINNVVLIQDAIDSIILLIAGITGVKYCNDPEHANINLIMGGLVLLSTFIGLFTSKDISIFSLIGFILPVLYLIGAYLNKKTDIDEFNEENSI